MTTDELEKLLRAWGHVFGERRERAEEERDAPAVHPIAVGMTFALKTRGAVIRARTSMHRAGQDRRKLMAVAAGGATVGVRVVPAAYVDPIPCTETRTGRSEARDWPVPPQVARVERAALDLAKVSDFRARCLRLHYCALGSHEDKVLRLGIALGEDVKIKRFRDELAYSRVWMHGRLAV